MYRKIIHLVFGKELMDAGEHTCLMQKNLTGENLFQEDLMMN